MNNKVNFKTVSIDGLNIFYREAGDKSKPTILFLGGFPSSSISFRNLIEDLKNDYHVIAPDYPGFGNSDAPTTNYKYAFDNLTITVEKFIEKIGLKKSPLYAFDYGGPIGFRIASKKPELIQSCRYRPMLPRHSGATFPPCSGGTNGNAKSVDSYCLW